MGTEIFRNKRNGPLKSKQHCALRRIIVQSPSQANGNTCTTSCLYLGCTLALLPGPKGMPGMLQALLFGFGASCPVASHSNKDFGASRIFSLDYYLLLSIFITYNGKSHLNTDLRNPFGGNKAGGLYNWKPCL